MTSPPSPAESRHVDLGSPPDLADWERVNGSPRRDETNQAWEREIKDDECMRDAPPPPPPRSRTNSVSDGAAAPREAVELCGVAMLLQHIMTNPPPGAEPAHLAAFWAEPDVPAPAGAAPLLAVGSCTISCFASSRRACTRLNAVYWRSCSFFAFARIILI